MASSSTSSRTTWQVFEVALHGPFGHAEAGGVEAIRPSSDAACCSAARGHRGPGLRGQVGGGRAAEAERRQDLQHRAPVEHGRVPWSCVRSPARGPPPGDGNNFRRGRAAS